MIKAVCKDCGHVFWAAVIMGENRCPKCSSENTYILIQEVIMQPCPFCGHKAKESDMSYYNFSGKRYYIVCPICHCHGPNAGSEAEAIAAWDERI